MNRLQHEKRIRSITRNFSQNKFFLCSLFFILFSLIMSCHIGGDLDILREQVIAEKEAKNPSYTVTFVSNGGIPAPAPQKAANNERVTQPAAMTRSGYTFDGWYTSAFTTQWDFTHNTVTKDITLYAKWNPVAAGSYTVTFNTNGGSYIADQVIASGGTASRPTDPSRSGYTFDGWYSNAGLTTTYSFSTPVTRNITLYAKWNPVAAGSYTVTFNTSGGSYIADQVIASGGTASRPADPSRSGYTFGNWYSNAGLTTVYNFSTPVTGNITLYAKWNPVVAGSYTITFNTNGGSNIADQVIASGGTASRPADPSRSGYTFDNWYSNAGLTTVYNFSTPVTGNITLYAKWNEVANQTPVATDFDIGNLNQTWGSVTAVTITPKPDKTTGTITVRYNGLTTLPTAAGSYTITFDVAAATGWNAVTGLSGGTLTVNKAAGVFGTSFTINTTYSAGMTLADVSLPVGYAWSVPATSLSMAVSGQSFSATYTDPSGNYEAVNGAITVNIAKAAGAAVTTPTLAARTIDSITINAVPAPANGQSTEYAINTTNTAPATGWQTGLTFSGLSTGTAYYIFARSVANDNYNTGTAAGVEIATIGQESLTITFMQIEDLAPNITGPTLRLTGSAAETVKTITVDNPAQYDSGSIQWFYNGNRITGTAVSGNYYETLSLNSTIYNKIGTHYVTVGVMKDGKMYSKVISFTVTM